MLKDAIPGDAPLVGVAAGPAPWWRRIDVPRTVATAKMLLWPLVLLFGLGMAAIPLITWLRGDPASGPARPGGMGDNGAARVIPPAELPSVEPLELRALPPDAARAWNAAVPLSTDPNPAARPFRLLGSEADQARAVDCLAAAVLYEAGKDPIGEQAVAQVVLNRVRHPAFPKTICGVVFQGSERSTGCQFTFTCDRAMARPVDPGAWQVARGIALNALQGSVFRPVGYATHYHTDWVVPYWSASLDKIAIIHTHLFFRWTGWWGTPRAFDRRVLDVEPVVPQLAALSAAHRAGADGLPPVPVLTIDPAALIDPTPPKPAPGDGNTFLLTLQAGVPAENFATYAASTCGARSKCRFMAWSDAALTPASLPLESKQIAALSFTFVRDGAGQERAQWDCTRFQRPDPAQCLRLQAGPKPAAPTQPQPAAEAPAPITGTKSIPDKPVPPPRDPRRQAPRAAAQSTIS